MASSSSSSSSVPPAASLTADDLIRIFNDPEGELLNYKHKMAEVPTTKVDDIFHMEVPFDAIKVRRFRTPRNRDGNNWATRSFPRGR